MARLLLSCLLLFVVAQKVSSGDDLSYESRLPLFGATLESLFLGVCGDVFARSARSSSCSCT